MIIDPLTYFINKTNEKLKENKEYYRTFMRLFSAVKNKIGLIYTCFIYFKNNNTDALFHRKRKELKTTRFKYRFPNKATLEFFCLSNEYTIYSLKKREYRIKVLDRRVIYVNIGNQWNHK